MGATFRVVLPVMATAVDPTAPTETREHPARSITEPDVEAISAIDLAGTKVLVVDDEPDARLLIQRLLEDRHASVLTASSAAEALQMLQRESADVIVSDIGMPGEDGFSLIRRIRAIKDRNAATPAVALTAYARVEDRVKAIQAGFQMHLSKPVEPMELVTMVASLACRQKPAGE